MATGKADIYSDGSSLILFSHGDTDTIFSQRGERREKAKKEPSRTQLSSSLHRHRRHRAGSPSSRLPLPFAIIFFSSLPLYTAASLGRMISRRITLSLCAKLDVQRRRRRKRRSEEERPS